MPFHKIFHGSIPEQVLYQLLLGRLGCAIARQNGKSDGVQSVLVEEGGSPRPIAPLGRAMELYTLRDPESGEPQAWLIQSLPLCT